LNRRIDFFTFAFLLSNLGDLCGKMFLGMKYLVLDMLALYKAFLSPFFPPACRFEPTCSQYASDAVEKYGAIRGTWMGLWRILRCQPFCKGGHDPVR
jgi:uncharacterized protein